MRRAQFDDEILTYTGASPTRRPHRWVIEFRLAYQGQVINNFPINIAAADETVADTIADRCIAEFAATGRRPSPIEQKDPERNSDLREVDYLKALRDYTGQPLLWCLYALRSQHAPAHGGDAVLALAAYVAMKEEREDWSGTWAQASALTMRRNAPILDTLFPLAA